MKIGAHLVMLTTVIQASLWLLNKSWLEDWCSPSNVDNRDTNNIVILKIVDSYNMKKPKDALLLYLTGKYS